eukprot:CAMPEP_0117431172 /NCGR_PEP_ID=MMETSP0758-20121206/10721_1 /TAXON_ID=63605 /ORGANISM="Percolomonas cosmopolitus, Strain AE-1 (ATCC 50343)" /LENGTH=517 /DNA_ID=CAMNT_0005219945 /DNA_START=290 /DNA_END=1844 /DNA_ORIENTATION=+
MYCFISRSIFLVIPWNAGLKTEIDSSNALFCVYFDHSPVVSKTHFYDAKTDYTQTQVDTEIRTVQQSQWRRKTLFSTSYDKATSVQEPTTGYRASNNVKLMFSTDATTFSSRGPFTIPSGTFSSLCDDTEAVNFLEPLSRTCYRRVTNLATSCSSEFLLSTYTTNLYISANARVSTSNTDSTNIGMTLHASSATGTANLDSATQCSNAVTHLKYVISTTTDNKISAINVIATLSTVTAAAAPSTTSPLYVKQTYEVLFDSATTPTLSSAGNIIVKPGNPGYIPGGPILSGVAETLSDNSKTAVRQRIEGFKVYSGGDCSARSTTNVNFDQDLITSCRLPLNAADLATFCANSATSVPFISELVDNRFGRFGSANYLLSTDWLSLFTSSPPQASWDATNQICSNLGAIVEYNFVIAKAGSVVNEQWQIVGVSQTYVSQSWQFDSNKGATNDFYLQFRVSFTRADQTQSQQLYNIPTLALTLPDDVFYPFSLVFGAAATPAPLYILLILQLFLAVVLIF